MANQSTLRPTLSSLLKQYLELLRSSPKYARVLTAAVFCGILGGLYQRRRSRQKAEEHHGMTLVRRNSEVKLNDGSCCRKERDSISGSWVLKTGDTRNESDIRSV
jgi:ATP-binding cassette subfamily D (ALD) long-chain fatty acid import protein